MVQPTTANSEKCECCLGKYPDITVAVTSLTNANPAVVTSPPVISMSFQGSTKLRSAAPLARAWRSPMAATRSARRSDDLRLIGVDTSAGAAPANDGISAAVTDKTGTITYAAPCGFTSKNVTISKNLAEVSIPDCDDPDAPIWLGRDVQSQSCVISGDGVAAAELFRIGTMPR